MNRRKFLKALGIGALAPLGFSCSKKEEINNPLDEPPIKIGGRWGHYIFISEDEEGRKVVLTDPELGDPETYNIFGVDTAPADSIFDYIDINVPENSPLRKYANPESLKVAFDSVEKTGKVVEE